MKIHGSKQLVSFKEILSSRQQGSGFFHTLMTYKPGEQQYGTNFFTNLDEIRRYWSDTVDIKEWGINGKPEYNGGHRTFIYGTIK